MKRRLAATTCLSWALLTVATGSAAMAHGDYVESSPRADSFLTKVPTRIVVTLTEPPSETSRFVAKDPCGNVTGDVSVSSNDIIATVLARVQAGEWQSNGRRFPISMHTAQPTPLKFRVRGEPDGATEEMAATATETGAQDQEKIDSTPGSGTPPGSDQVVLPRVSTRPWKRLAALALIVRKLGT